MGSGSPALRPPLTSLIGRDAEVDRLLRLLADPEIRLVTLTGPGGVGKTRLALRVAELVEARGSPQVEVVDLSAVEDPSGMMGQIARSFDIWQLARVPPLDRLASEIGAHPYLLVLDNLEQIASGAPELVTLLERCPGLTVLVTSRVPLNVSVEQRVPVATLPIPSHLDGTSPDGLTSGSAVDLFVARARLVDPAFALHDRNRADVLEICRRLDGLPLAIELAAARIRELPPTMLAANLGRALPILTGGPHDRPQRHRAMRDTIAWSYRLLDERQKTLVRVLSVFRSSFSFDSAFALVSDDAAPLFPDTNQMLESLSTLLHSNLLLPDDEPGTGARYRMLTTVREFGAEQLALSADEETRVRNTHAGLLLDTIALEVPGVYGSSSVTWLRLVDAHRADLDSAVAWSFDRGDAVLGVELAATASSYWFNLGRLDDSIRWLLIASDAALARRDVVPPERLASLWIETVLAATMSGRFELGHAVGESTELRSTLAHCGPHFHVSALTARSMLADFRREFDTSLALAQQALALARLYPDVLSLPWALTRMGWELQTMGRREEARVFLAEAHAAFSSRNDPLGEAILGGDLAQIYLAEGDLERASALLVRCFALQLDMWDPWGAVSDVATAAEIALAIGEPALAALLIGACSAGDVQNRIAQQPYVSGVIERITRNIRSALGEEEFARLYLKGTQSSLPAALDLGLDVARRAAGEIPREPAAHLEILTTREREVLQLVSAGRTDRQIADTLFVSRRTVNTHVTHILTKLDVNSRAEAAAEAVRRNLV